MTKKGASVSWLAPPERLMINDGEVHIWRAALEMTPPQLTSMVHILSADELSRAGRYHFPKDRDCFIAARGLLRTILGRYVDKNPGDLLFSYGPNGKPELAGEAGGKFRFNVSHSHGLSLFAVTLNRKIGIDLEYIRPELAADEFAEQVLSTRELLEFKAVPPHDRPVVFFDAWTRKEAYLKARGQGLSEDLKQLEVAFPPGGRDEFPGMNGSGQAGFRWSLMDLTVPPEYAGAVVVEGQNLQFKFWQWENQEQPVSFF